jgi:hypothetical protein
VGHATVFVIEVRPLASIGARPQQQLGAKVCDQHPAVSIRPPDATQSPGTVATDNADRLVTGVHGKVRREAGRDRYFGPKTRVDELDMANSTAREPICHL